MANILVCDDDREIVEAIEIYLKNEGYTVFKAYDGEEALRLAKDKSIDIIILDLMLPKIDGLSVCQKIRDFSRVPIIMLTAKADDIDKILGLEYGADDYLTKPFNILELKARVKAILRRSRQEKTAEKKRTESDDGNLEIDDNLRKIKIDGRWIELTSKEFDLMDLFINNPGKVYSRENLLDIVWGYDYPGDIRTVDVHVRRLREKIEPNPATPAYILTKWGVGYYFKKN